MATPSECGRLVRLFPRLTGEEFEIICPASGQYNCIAYAAGDTSQPWSDEPEDYWPPEVARNPSIAGLENLFRWLGFKKCRGSRLETAYQKVALYASKGLWTHVALQMSNGRWRSKLGKGVLIEHRTPLSLTGDLYGNVYLYMRTRRQ